MKLKNEFVTQEIDGDQIMVSSGETGFYGLVRSNETAAFIVDCLKQDTTKEHIVDAMFDRYDASRDVIEKSVDAVLNKLVKIGAIED